MQVAKVLHGEKWAATQNGHGSEVALPQLLPSSLWSKVRSLFKWEDLIVAGREVKGIVLTPTMTLTLVLAIASGCGMVYWRMSDRMDAYQKSNDSNHDLLIRLDQRLLDQKEQQKKEDEDLAKRLQNIDALNIAQGRDIATLKAEKGN
jgi:hypothetical protein